MYNLTCQICNLNLKEFKTSNGYYYCNCPPTTDHPKCSGVFISYIKSKHLSVSFCYIDAFFHFSGDSLIIYDKNNNFEFNISIENNFDSTFEFIDYVYIISTKYKENLLFL